VKKLNQLLVIEADDNLPPLLSQFRSLLATFSELPVTSQSVIDFKKNNIASPAQLVLFHSNLNTIPHLQQFVDIYGLLGFSAIIIVGEQIDYELCLLALEAGAEDAIAIKQLSRGYMQKAVILSLRRSRIEKELNQNREQLLATLQNTPNVAVQWYNRDGKVLFWNNASERIFGWRADQAVGKTIDELVVMPENKNFWRNKIRHLAETNTSYGPNEWWFTCGDGTECCCISTLFPIPSVGIEPWFVCMDVDVTAQKQMEKALLKGEEKYRSLLEQQADAVIIFNETGKVLDVNTSAEELLQYARQELQQMNLNDILNSNQVEEGPVPFDLLSKGESTIKQRKMRRKNGELIETEVHAKRLVDGIFLASIRDLAKRIEVQHRLEKEIELSNTIINSLPGLFYIFTRKGEYLRWNKRLETITGYTADEIKEMMPLDFIDKNDSYVVQKAIEEAFNHGHAFIEANLLSKDGEKIPFYFTGTAIKFANAQCLLGTGIDLSPLKSLEAKLSQQKITEQKKVMQAMIDAEEKERNKLGLELHDNVNQILSVVRMYLAILNSDQPMQEVTLSKTIELLNKAMEEIRQLSHSLAVSYKFETGFADALQTLVDQIKLTKDFSIELNIVPKFDEYASNNQKLAIYRILQEQLNNIMKHAKASNVKVDITITGKNIVLSVLDNGEGFNTANIDRGLGLNNITNRAEALEGNVSIQSAPGEGCLLTVAIPIHIHH
jgi:PAS domain S-box-containing protein